MFLPENAEFNVFKVLIIVKTESDHGTSRGENNRNEVEQLQHIEENRNITTQKYKTNT